MAFSLPNLAEGVYIITSEGIAYHQAAGGCTLACDDMQRRSAAFDDIRRTSCVDDMPSLRLG